MSAAFPGDPSAPPSLLVRHHVMISVDDYEKLPGFPEPSEVRRLTELVLRESESEVPDVTLAKLDILSDRQWRTYTPAPEKRKRGRGQVLTCDSTDNGSLIRSGT